MANTIKLEVYMKQIERLIDEWVKDMGAEIIKLENTLVAIATEELVDPPDKKKIDKLKKDLDKIKENIEGINLGLKVSMMGISDPIEAEPTDLTKKLPTWLKELIKKKGVKLGKHATIAPTVDFDMKSKKLKSFGIKITW